LKGVGHVGFEILHGVGEGLIGFGKVGRIGVMMGFGGLYLMKWSWYVGFLGIVRG